MIKLMQSIKKSIIKCVKNVPNKIPTIPNGLTNNNEIPKLVNADNKAIFFVSLNKPFTLRTTNKGSLETR